VERAGRPATCQFPQCVLLGPVCVSPPQRAMPFLAAMEQLEHGLPPPLWSIIRVYHSVCPSLSRPQPAVLPHAARGGPLPVTRSPSCPAAPGRLPACQQPTGLASGAPHVPVRRGAPGGAGRTGHALACAPAGARGHRVGGHGRWKRPLNFLSARAAVARGGRRTRRGPGGAASGGAGEGAVGGAAQNGDAIMAWQRYATPHMACAGGQAIRTVR
jgi:hypothetical protein